LATIGPDDSNRGDLPKVSIWLLGCIFQFLTQAVPTESTLKTLRIENVYSCTTRMLQIFGAAKSVPVLNLAKGQSITMMNTLNSALQEPT
jgi:hypothetical protein